MEVPALSGKVTCKTKTIQSKTPHIAHVAHETGHRKPQQRASDAITWPKPPKAGVDEAPKAGVEVCSPPNSVGVEPKAGVLLAPNAGVDEPNGLLDAPKPGLVVALAKTP
jgi:hypothetical protein